MTDTTVALITSIVTLLTVLVNAYLTKRTKVQVADVHELVNDRAEKQDARVAQLTESLQDSGTAVPSVPVKGSTK